MELGPSFIRHRLDESNLCYVGRLPGALVGDDAIFAALWDLRRADRPWITIHSKPVQVPRWQQAYGVDYQFSGRVSRAVPIPQILAPFVQWAKSEVDAQLNGLLLNWYDDATKDYIGPHHDKTKGLVNGSPIVTISFGARRTFRLTQGKGGAREVRDFEAVDGTVFVLPWGTNLQWKHEVPHFASNRGRRISVTLRAFTSGQVATRREVMVASEGTP